MKKNIFYTCLIALTSSIALTGCGGNDKGLLDKPITPPIPPEITALTIEGAPIVGIRLTANVDCDLCVSEKYQYKWVINNLVAGTESTYVYQAADVGFDVQLEVMGENKHKQKTKRVNIYETIATKQIVTNNAAFAALNTDGIVTTWGFGRSGGESFAIESELVNIKKIETSKENRWAFAAIDINGKAVVWGNPSQGGDASIVQAELQDNISSVSFNVFNGAALTKDGQVISWGAPATGGDASSNIELSSGVEKIIPSNHSFFALKKTGKAICFGECLGVDNAVIATDVKSVISSRYAVAVLKKNGAVKLTGIVGGLLPDVSNELNEGVLEIVTDNDYGTSSTSTKYFFAAKKESGIVTWGMLQDDGKYSSAYYPIPGEKSIITTKMAFSVLSNSSVVSFGAASFGGNASAVENQLKTGVTQVVGNEKAFAALKDDGSVVVWGDIDNGGSIPVELETQLSSSVIKLFATRSAFAALKENGSVVCWGSASVGGNCDAVKEELTHGVFDIVSSRLVFVAKKSDGTVVTWGNSSNGGDNLTVPHDRLNSVFVLIDTALLQY